MKQTAVGFLENQYNSNGKLTPVDFYQAKEMEKKQIIDARVNGVSEGIDIGSNSITEDISKNHEIYYNEKFKNK